MSDEMGVLLEIGCSIPSPTYLVASSHLSKTDSSSSIPIPDSLGPFAPSRPGSLAVATLPSTVQPGQPVQPVQPVHHPKYLNLAALDAVTSQISMPSSYRDATGRREHTSSLVGVHLSGFAWLQAWISIVILRVGAVSVQSSGAWIISLPSVLARVCPSLARERRLLCTREESASGDEGLLGSLQCSRLAYHR